MRRRSPLITTIALLVAAVLVLPTTAATAATGAIGQPSGAQPGDALLTATFADEALTLTPASAPVQVPESATSSGELAVSAETDLGDSLSPLTLALSAVSGPGTATVQIADGTPLMLVGDTAEVSSTAPSPVTVDFTAACDYSLTFDARISLQTADSDAPETSREIIATPVILEFDVAAPAATDPESQTAPAASAPSAAQEPTATAADATVPSVPATAATAATTADGRPILSRGLVGLTPRITDESHVQLGLVDQTRSTRDATKQTFYAADEVVLHLPNQDAAYPGGDDPDSEIYQSFAKVYDPAAHFWSTPSAVGSDDEGESDYSTVADRLLVALYAGANYHKNLGSGINAGVRNDINGALSYSVSAVDGPGGFLAYKRLSDVWPLDEGNGPLWTDTDHSRTAEITKGSSTGEPIGLTFTTTGVYCVTVGVTVPFSSGASRTSSAAYTIVVGELPATVPTCAQPDDTDPSENPGDSPVVQYDRGHLDVRAGVKNNELSLGVNSTLVPFERAVLSGTQQGVVPPADEAVNSSFFGDAGQPYWYFPQVNSADETWPGFNTESIDASQVQSSITFTLTGVTGPGDVALWDDGGGFDPVFSTRLGLPMSREFPTNSHFHNNWSFTQPGLYCLALTARAQLADGHWSTTSGVLTIVAGTGIDPTTVVPCERAHTPVPSQNAHRAPRDLIDGSTVYRDGYVQLDAYLGGGGLDVATAHRQAKGGATQYRDLDDTILSTSFHNGDVWTIGNMRPGISPWITATTTSLAADQLAAPGVTRISIGDVRGPGRVTLGFRQGKSIGSAEDAPKDYLVAQQGTVGSSSWSFTEPGVYCIPLTFTVPSVDGFDIAVTKTVTAVAGSEANVSRAGIVTCADGGQPTAPHGGSGAGPSTWDVPNGSTTRSGATILNNGHIDIASLVEGAALTTRVKDTTQSASPVWRDPAATVLQVLPDAQVAVPDTEAFRFLGRAGDPVWQVPQTQQEGLLWPGWSTESIATTVTQGGVNWTLRDASGPGEFALFTSSATQLGAVDLRFNTRDGITGADSFVIPKNTHAHGTWLFSAEGDYCLAFTRSTVLTDGTAVSDAFTLAVGVGRTDIRALDPAACFAAPVDRPVDDTTSVDDAKLTDSAAGDVRLLGADTYEPGQLVSVNVGKQHAGDWVSLWLHSTPTWLGWVRVNDDGIAQVRLPADAALGAHKLVVKDRDGRLVGWSAIRLIAAPVAAGAAPAVVDGAPALRQLAANRCVAGATIISSGHVDYSSQIVNGALQSLVGDDTSGAKVYREPSGVILWLKPSSRVTLPVGYGQIGAAGSTIWQIPQTQNPDLVWLGWNTEALSAGTSRGAVSWSLDSVNGPGRVSVYLAGAFGSVQSVVLAGAGSDYDIPLGVHAHGNWAFSAEGTYRLTMTQAVTLADGRRSSDTETLRIVVGDVDPASAGTGTGCASTSGALVETAGVVTQKPLDEATDSAVTVLPKRKAEAKVAQAGFPDPFAALAQGDPVPLLVLILAALLVLGGVGALVLWRSRVRRAAALPVPPAAPPAA